MSKKKKKKKQNSWIRQHHPINIPQEIQKALELHRTGQIAEARSIYERILEVDPNCGDALNLLGAARYQECKYREAESLILKALDIQPRNISYYNNLGAVYQAVERKDEAIECFQKALDIDPGFLDARYNLSAVLLNTGDSERAMKHLQETLAVNPDNADTHFNIALIYRDRHQYDEAVEHFQKAVRLDPEHVEAHYKLGVTYRDQGKVDDAIAIYRKTLELKPDHHIAFSRMIHLMQYRCDWDELAKLTPKLDRITAESKSEEIQTAETPFENITRHTDLELNHRIARSWSLDMQRRVSHLAMSHAPPARKKGRITIGYLSNDFRDHPVGHLIQRLFALHDRDHFEIHAYSFGKNDESECRKQIMSCCDKFVDIKEVGNRDAADMIKENQVDILVDLMGYTGGSRLELLAHRPAPVQATYLGYPGTTGADFVDYIITDTIVTPDAAAPYYSEKMIRMPYCYLVTNNAQPVTNHGWRKTDFGLPENGFVFCSFNAFYKMEPVMFAVWMRILNRVSGSVLWVPNTLKKNKENFQKFMEAHGVDPARLIYAKRLPDKAEHLERLGKADLILDTRIYNGHASCCDALWAGVPVVALTGSHFASRVSTSALAAMHLSELAVNTLEAYEELAVQLATDRRKYSELRNRLIRSRQTAPLFNTPAFTRTLEKGYIHMWETFMQGSPPRPLDLEPDAAYSMKETGRENVAAKLEKAAGLHRSGNLDAAQALYQEILQIDPSQKDALHLLGVAAHQKGGHQEAEMLIRKAVAIDPKIHWYHGNLGLALQALGRLDEAVAAYQTALSLKPGYFECHNNLGTAWKDSGEFDKAESCYRKSLELKPDYAVAHYNLGILYQEQNGPADAARYLEKALTFNPAYADACNLLVHQLQQICDWEKIRIYKPRRDEFTRQALQAGRKPAEKPFENIITNDDPALNFAVARAWAAEAETEAARLGLAFEYGPPEKPAAEKITIGYFSKDFRNHAVGHLIRSLFKTHDRNRFRVHCYSYGENDRSDYRREIEKDCDMFVDIREMDSRRAAERIHEDGVHILVNLMGYTGGENRLPVFAARPSPVQVSWLGYPGTTGASFFDYIITDRIVTPESHLPYYSEHPVFMPHSYQINDNRQAVAEASFTRESLGLPPEGVIFCSFSQHYKIEPVMFGVWMTILSRVPNSVLWLIYGNPESRRRLQEAARSSNIDPSRLIFARHESKDRHLARHRLADIALDTRIVNGHTTASDALWAGVPVITWIGNHFASRVAASLLSAVGLPELVVNSAADYENLAVRLARQPEQLAAIRRKLAENRLAAPLFDTERFVNNLENAYIRMWDAYLRKSGPGWIDIIEQPPADINAKMAEGVQHHQTGRFEAAGRCYRRVLDIRPDHPDALHLSGVLAYQTKDYGRAEGLIRKAIALQPNTPGFYSNLGLVLAGLDRTAEALQVYRTALSIDSNLADVYSNMGNALRKENRLEEALECYYKALAIKPDYPEACYNLANVLKTKGRLPEAADCYRKAIALKPGYVQAHNALGVVYKRMGDLNRAMERYRTALEISPENADTYNNMGNALVEMGESDKGIAHYRRALELNPESVETLNNLGNELKNRGAHEDALACFEKAFQIKPDYKEAAANLYTQYRLLCLWENLDSAGRKVDEFTQECLKADIRPAESPFINLIRHMHPETNLTIARAWSRDVKRRAAWRKNELQPVSVKEKNGKIRIGYLSNDFRNHPVGHIVQPLFELHNRDEFEVVCFSYSPGDDSVYQKKIMNDCDRFIDIRALPHIEAARAVMRNNIDILVDLMGYTTGSRIDISAYRPAPVQASWLGYPGTTGADWFDYIIADRVVIPESHMPFYSEKPVFMPYCYLIFNNSQSVSTAAYQRENFNLPAAAFVFCSFNSVYKIEPAVFDAWMKILGRVPDGVLWLSQSNRTIRNNLIKEAENRGIDGGRLVFAERIAEKADHLARLKLADLVLDTWGYNGHVSTADALWAGVPVLTRKGGHFASRVAASILYAADVPDLVAESAQAYENKAAAIAQDPEERSRIRKQIDAAKNDAPFFDTAGFVRNLERAYRRMHQRRLAGETPDVIDLQNAVDEN